MTDTHVNAPCKLFKITGNNIFVQKYMKLRVLCYVYDFGDACLVTIFSA